jgi:Iron-containing redox enzyme
VRQAVTPQLPEPRGNLSEWVIERLQTASNHFVPGSSVPPIIQDDPLFGDDFHLALYICYELHYRGFEGVDEGWEWQPWLLTFRRSLEDSFLSSLVEAVTVAPTPPEEVVAALRSLSEEETLPSLSKYMAARATRDDFAELLMHRSVYHLKEADPHSWALPRLGGRPKVALAEIQSDEYGSGRPERLHAQLFADAMAAFGLDPSYGAYANVAPGVTLGALNLMSLFGLHRRWRGAVVGHLALFEMTSSEPNRRLGDGLRRLGFGPDTTAFFDEHVEADSVHELIALHDLAGALALSEPLVADDIVFGARALQRFDQESAGRLIGAWSEGRSSLFTSAKVGPAPAR